MNWYLLETINLSRGENREQQIFPFTASIVSFTKDLQRITTDSCCQLKLNRFFIDCERFFIFHGNTSIFLFCPFQKLTIILQTKNEIGFEISISFENN